MNGKIDRKGGGDVNGEPSELAKRIAAVIFPNDNETIYHVVPRRKLAGAVIEAELIKERFKPMGDNHHNAMKCPYCNLDVNK